MKDDPIVYSGTLILQHTIYYYGDQNFVKKLLSFPLEVTNPCAIAEAKPNLLMHLQDIII